MIKKNIYKFATRRKREKKCSYMKRNLSTADARRILARVPQQVSFWLCTNEHLRNLESLGKALQMVNDEVFKYHVNRDKNDFETWIRDIIRDKELAREISRIKTRETLVRKILERIEELRKIVKKSSKKSVRKSKKAKYPKKRLPKKKHSPRKKKASARKGKKRKKR